MSRPADSIHQLLDRHLAALRSAGHKAKLDQPGRSREDVRAALTEANYGDCDAVIDFFSWAQYPDPSGRFALFEYYSSPFSLREAIQVGLSNRQIWFEDFPKHNLNPHDMLIDHKGNPFPKADQVDLASWVPIARGVDNADLVVLDTSDHPIHGGSIWLTANHAYLRSHDSLADAIRGATRCVESGQWVIEDEVRIVWPNRTTAFRFAETDAVTDPS